jgi:peptidoglycan/LPS O-acetylase OafA/YrhL
MNLDELMAVWRSQDAAPLHDVDKTLLHLALRQDEAKLQRERRRVRWFLYLFSAGVIAGMALVLAIMIDRERATGWDVALLVVGAASALLSGRATYMHHLAQLQREQSFGESLRDQLNRGIAQLDDEVASARRTSILVTVLVGGICPVAILLAIWRLNEKSISDDGFQLVSLIMLCAWTVASSVWALRSSVVEGDVLPRKRRLEGLLKELEAE